MANVVKTVPSEFKDVQEYLSVFAMPDSSSNDSPTTARLERRASTEGEGGKPNAPVQSEKAGRMKHMAASLTGHSGGCKEGEKVDDWSVALVAFVLMMLAFSGQLMIHGTELRWLMEDEALPDKENRRVQNHGTRIFIIVLAVLAELFAAYFYYNQVKRCNGLKGFAVFIVITGLAGFLATSYSIPPRRKVCQNAEELNGSVTLVHKQG